MLCGGRDGSGGGVGGALCLPDIDAADGRVLTLTKGKARVVAIDTQDAGVWADVVAAAADGFEVLVTRVPSEVRPSTLRKVVTRL